MATKIKAIFFDVAGTLLETSHLKAISYISREVSKQTGIDPEIIENQFVDNFRKNFKKAREIKFKTITKILEKSLSISLKNTNKKFNLAKNIRKWYKEYIEKEVKIFPSVYNTLKSLKQMNFKLGIISNSDIYLTKHMLKKFSLSNFFDAIITSSTAKCYKPDSRIFELGLLKLGCKAEETMFVGNSGKDVSGAKSVGMIAVLLKNNEELETSPDFIISDLGEIFQLLQNLQ
ncbi:MAG: HAD family hydrolase [Candidatus Aenigmarchaeota archaeon]|nr:HAD family hydrolase [Candidatus Aenigmarchaeota archaeon]